MHEGPHGISSMNKTRLLEGMCVSNEPGYYKEGEFGIRIENVMMCQRSPEPHMKETFYCWENLTVAPYCRELIDTNLLDEETIAYINDFHQKCLRILTPLLQGDNQYDKRALAYVNK